MARKNPVPKYRKQKRPKGIDAAFVEINGQHRYLGAYGSAESKEAYGRLIAEWQSRGGPSPAPAERITVSSPTV